jgi:hypothetical protein
MNATPNAIDRYYDNFIVMTPGPDVPVINSGQSIEFRHDATIREDSAGTFYGAPPSYRGTRMVIPPGTSRVAVKVRRVELSNAAADSVTDSTSMRIGWTQRGLAVPR